MELQFGYGRPGIRCLCVLCDDLYISSGSSICPSREELRFQLTEADVEGFSRRLIGFSCTLSILKKLEAA